MEESIEFILSFIYLFTICDVQNILLGTTSHMDDCQVSMSKNLKSIKSCESANSRVFL